MGLTALSGPKMRTKLAYTLLVLVAIAVSGCKNERYQYEGQESLSFLPVISIPTRADSASVYPSNVPFGFYGYTLPSSSSYSANSTNAELKYDNTSVSYSNGAWVPSDDPTKTKSGQRLTIFAYSPYGAKVGFSQETGVTITDFDITDDEILVADPIYDYSLYSSGGQVPLPFRHSLTDVSFYVFTNDAYAYNDESEYITKEVIVKSLSIEGFGTKGSYTQLPTAAWTLSDSGKSINLYEGDMSIGDQVSKIGETVTMMPQVFTAKVSMSVQFIENGYAYNPQTFVAEKTFHWGIGGRCTYIIRVYEDKIDFSQISEVLK